MKQHLIHFLTKDKLRLPGILFEPTELARKVAIYLHGNGTSSVFYDPSKIVLGKELTDKGISFFPFNNRGAHLIKSLKRQTEDGEERAMYGTAFELIKDCILDIDAAIAELTKKGYNEFYLIGESTGANKIVVYNYYKPQNNISKYILLSGGDDTGLYYEELGNEKFFEILNTSKQMVDKGKGEELLTKDLYAGLPMSYQAMYDTLNPDGDYNIFPYNEVMNNLQISSKKLLREYKSIEKPTLVVYGSEDEFCYGKVPECVEILKKNTSKPELFQYEIIQGADHGFSGGEDRLHAVITSFLTK